MAFALPFAITTPGRAEPEYRPLNCEGGHHTALDARSYLDMFGATNDDRHYCPPLDWFIQATGWFPEMAWEETIADDYGWVPVQQPGAPGEDACTSIAPDTGPSFDFEIPCRAHDYCYSLRDVGFHETVTKEDCDALFYDLMTAHCNNRAAGHRVTCLAIATEYFALVTANPGAAPNPPMLRFRRASLPENKCADVAFGSLDFGVPVNQYTCSASNAQWFRPWQNRDGSFRLIRKGTGDRCLTYNTNEIGAGITQDSCDSPRQFAWNTWRITEFFGTNKYVLVPTYRIAERDSCMTAPAAETSGDFEPVYEDWCEFQGNRFWWLDAGR